MSDPTTPTTLPTFPTTPYKPDAGYTAGGLLMLISALAAIGALLGYLTHLIAHWFYFILFFPMLIGFVIGAIGIRMVNIGRIRNPWLGGLAGFFAGIFAMTAMHYFDYEEFHSKFFSNVSPQHLELAKIPERQLPQTPPKGLSSNEWTDLKQYLRFLRIDSFPKFMDYQARVGVTIQGHHGTSGGINLGRVGSYIYWIIEMLIVAGITFAMVHEATSKPYCRQCDRWKTSKVLGYFSADPTTLTTALNSGDLPTLAVSHPTPLTTPLRLSAAACDTCLGQNPIDLKLEQLNKDKKGNTETKTLTHVSYPPAALPFVASLFPQQILPPTLPPPAV